MPRVTKRPVAKEESTTMTEQERNEVVERARLALANAKGAPNPNWDESKHPRGAGGRFGHGNGGAKAGGEEKETPKAKSRNAQRRDELVEEGNDLVGRILDGYHGVEDADDEAFSEYSENAANDFEDWALTVISDYPVPRKSGPAREKALAARKALIRKVGNDTGLFGPNAGDGWQGMSDAVGRELGWWK